MAAITKAKGDGYKAQVVLRQPNKAKGLSKLSVSVTRPTEKMAREYGAKLEANIAEIKNMGIKIHTLPLDADTYSDIKRKLGKTLLPEIISRIAPEQSGMTVHQAINKYIETGRSLKSGKKVEGNMDTIRLLMWWDAQIGEEKLSDVDYDMIDAAADIKAKTRAVATVNRHISAMTCMLNWAHRHKWIAHYPLPKGMKRKGEPKPQPKPLGNFEFEGALNLVNMDLTIKSLLDACEYLDNRPEYRQKFKQMKLIVQVYLATGQRRQEILDMEWKKTDLSKGKAAFKVGTKTSGDDEETFVLVEGARQLLIAERKRQMKDGSMGKYVFGIGKREKTYSGNQLARHFDAACDHAGIANYHIHDLRDTAATMMLNANNGNFALVAKMLGHSSVGELQKRYARWFDDTVRDAQEEAISSAVFS